MTDEEYEAIAERARGHCSQADRARDTARLLFEVRRLRTRVRELDPPRVWVNGVERPGPAAPTGGGQG